MIQKFTHATIFCLNQEEAKLFYTEKLGFEIRADVRMGDFRWLTVAPKGQPDLEMVLMEINQRPPFDESAAASLRELVKKGMLGGGVFETADCRATYEELKGRGVQFLGEPTERPYGIEVMLKDNSGNVFSVVQRPR
jgi:predicted enzyme related to lactoylglutathione lyase